MNTKTRLNIHARLIFSFLSVLTLFVLISCSQDVNKTARYLDVNLDFDSRVDELVGRMTLEFELDAEIFAVISEKGEKLMPPGEYEISIGGGQPGASVESSSHTLTAAISLE